LNLLECGDVRAHSVFKSAHGVRCNTCAFSQITNSPAKSRPGHSHLRTGNHKGDFLSLKIAATSQLLCILTLIPLNRVGRMSALPLKNELQLYHRLRERLVEHLPNIDDETIRDTLEGITDLHEMIAAVIRSALVDEALHAGLRFRVDDMKARLSRLEQRATKKRELALDAMTEVGLTKLEQPDFTASARSGSPALVIITEETIPKSYWLPQPPKLDRQAILGELKRGTAIPGTQMSNPKPVLSVRTK
jgi:hypothetical protein